MTQTVKVKLTREQFEQLRMDLNTHAFDLAFLEIPIEQIELPKEGFAQALGVGRNIEALKEKPKSKRYRVHCVTPRLDGEIISLEEVE